MNGLLDGQGKPIKDPFGESKVDVQTVDWLFGLWEAAEWPFFKTLRPSTTAQREYAKKNLTHPLKFFKGVEIASIDAPKLNQYFLWRTKNAAAGANLRATDIDLSSLSSLFGWGVQLGHIPSNPIYQRKRFSTCDDVKNCSLYQPRSDEELHDHARLMMDGERSSQSLGFQMLFEAYTGCRTSEVLAMRLDAKEGQSGYIEWAAGTIRINRAKRGVLPNILIEQFAGSTALLDLIHAHKKWHKKAWGDSPWFFPGVGGSQPVGATSLGKKLNKTAKALGVGKRTSHGMRAFFVRTMRAQAFPDEEIALRLGQNSGADLITRVYGEREVGWIGCKAQDWLPENPAEVAYKKWKKVEPLLEPLSNLRLPTDGIIKANAING
jgi:integrase